METLQYQVQENKDAIKKLEDRFDKIVDKFETQEEKLEERIDERFNELKTILSNKEEKDRVKNKDLHSKIDTLVDNSHEQKQKMLEMKYDMKEMNNFIKKIEDKNKWLNRYAVTAAVGFCLTFLNAVIQTFFLQ